MPLPLSFDIVVDIFYERSHYVACNVSRMFLVNFLLRCTFPNHLLLPLPPPPLPPPFLPPFLPPVPPPPSSIETRCKWVFVECVVEIPRTKLSFAFVVCYVLFVCLLLLLSFLIKKFFFGILFIYLFISLFAFSFFLYFERITIVGGSNGGLLVGACINQRPELFGCAVSHVP